MATVGSHDVGVQRKAEATRARACDFFEQHGGVTKVAATAVGLGQHGVEQPFLARLAPDLFGHDAVALPLGVVWHDFFLKKAPRGRAKLLVVFAEDGAFDQVLHGLPCVVVCAMF